MVPRNGCDYDLVPARREMTVHDLFTHSSGLSYGFDQQSALDDLYRKALWQRLKKDSSLTLADFVAILTELPLAFHPGTAFRYSFSIDVLGYIIQLASGMPFEDFLQERVFDPLGMVDTAFWVPPDKVDRLAAIYGPAEDGGLKPLDEPMTSRYLKPPHNPSGGGGLVSTVSDYLRFGQMLLNQGELDGARLLGRKTVEWMLHNHLPEGIPANGDPLTALDWGERCCCTPVFRTDPDRWANSAGAGQPIPMVDRPGGRDAVPVDGPVYAGLHRPHRRRFRPTGLPGVGINLSSAEV